MKTARFRTRTVPQTVALLVLSLSGLLMGQSLNSIPANLTNGLIRTESEQFFEEGRAAFNQEVQNLLAPDLPAETLLEVEKAASLDENDLRELEEDSHHSSRFYQQRDRSD